MQEFVKLSYHLFCSHIYIYIYRIRMIPNHSNLSSASQNIPTTPCVAYAVVPGKAEYEELSFVRHDQAQEPPTGADNEAVHLSQESRQYDEIGSYVPAEHNDATSIQSDRNAHFPSDTTSL